MDSHGMTNYNPCRPQFPILQAKEKKEKNFISEKKIPACSAYSTEVGSNKAPAQPAKLQRNAAQCNAAYLI